MVLPTPGGGLGGPHWSLLQIPFPYDPDAENIADAVLFKIDKEDDLKNIYVYFDGAMLFAAA